MGGNIETKYVPRGVRTEVENKYKLCEYTVNKVWHRHNTGNAGQSRGRPKKFIEDDKEYVSALKQMHPSMHPSMQLVKLEISFYNILIMCKVLVKLL